jgi:hypothetical protein
MIYIPVTTLVIIIVFTYMLGMLTTFFVVVRALVKSKK